MPRRRSYDLCACESTSVFAACHVIKIQSCFFAPDMIYLKKKRSASSLRECPNRPCRETARVFRYSEYNVRIGRAHVREQVPPAENTFRNTRFHRPPFGTHRFCGPTALHSAAVRDAKDIILIFSHIIRKYLTAFVFCSIMHL